MTPTPSASIFGNPTLLAPEDPLAPPRDQFAEPWQASVLAIATAMIREGHFTQDAWANALGAALKRAETDGLPDTDETYFLAALSALEHLAEASGINPADRETRKSDWEDAYRQTPHGQPVRL